MENLIKGNRVESIDILRGIIIVLMGLDHIRDYFSYGFSPLNLATTTPAWFFTRWITHFCAPGFVFLAGVSAYLYGKRASKSQLAKFLASRGLWLIVIEFTLVHVGWTFSLTTSFFVQVIWAIGWSMIFLAGLIYLKRIWIGVITLLLLGGHNFLDSYQSNSLWWHFLHQPHFDFSFIAIAYPIIPWPAIMALGYLVGELFIMEPVSRKRKLISLGLIFMLLFVTLRLINRYGDPSPWHETHRGWTYDFLSFLNTTKYPPSLMYSLMTLGPLLILLALLENVKGGISKFFSIFGKVPFFFYIIHLYIIHLMAILFHGVVYDVWGRRFFAPPPPGYTPNLWISYLFWGILIAFMYFLCRWYGRIKKQYSYWWLKYL